MDLEAADPEEDEFYRLMRERPLPADYGSDGESFRESDEDEDESLAQPRHGIHGKFKREKSSSPSKYLLKRPVRTASQGTVYVLDRGLDPITGVERPNRWTGPPTSYRRNISDALEAHESLSANRARNLGAHLYNAFAIKNGTPETVQNPGNGDLKGEFYVSRPWTAWPQLASRVPRIQQTLRGYLDDPETFHMQSDPRSSADLEESIMATMMRSAKETFMSRQCDLEEVRVTRVRRGEDPDQMTDTQDEKTDFDGKEQTQSRRPVILQPVIQADDEKSRRQLRPMARNVITELDRLLMGLHHSVKGRVNDDESDSAPASDSGDSGDDESRSRSRRNYGSRSQSRGRRRKRMRQQSRQSDVSSQRSLSQRQSTGTSLRNQSMPSVSQSRGRSRTSRSSLGTDDRPTNRHRRGLRDWSEVMGLASMLGLPPAAVMRASKRCADLFGQDMTFQTLLEGHIQRVSPLEGSFHQYAYVESEGEPEAASPPPSTRHKAKASRQNPRARGADSHPSNALGASSQTAESSRAPRGKGEHRKADLICPLKRCPRHLDGFSRRWNLNLHLKRVHPSYTPGQSDRSRSQSMARPGPGGTEVIEID
ncbi:hypothetical protein N7462_008483 [Penicillium macrosclerotiorum]|uniref:uncharacterized protein n=1 Tax=Penicillium macrosclerotiorum TaxID=303699 RepID=UPI002548DD94|nr:uncharacterized protein N7462_008483 [Penicillium macrosclerotiorum]KAJ5675586.1 hypothetical protein N7462_008483 [Penicillium macrosclerotiorum]